MFAIAFCSPTALAMALSHLLNIDDRLQIEKLWAQLIEDCYDPVTKAYGMWPQAIFQASRLGYWRVWKAVQIGEK